jgi:hypothetical protein
MCKQRLVSSLSLHSQKQQGYLHNRCVEHAVETVRQIQILVLLGIDLVHELEVPELEFLQLILLECLGRDFLANYCSSHEIPLVET